MFNPLNSNKMKQTNLKTYESPKAEVIVIESQGVLCASGGTPTPTDISFGITNKSFGN